MRERERDHTVGLDFNKADVANAALSKSICGGPIRAEWVKHEAGEIKISVSEMPCNKVLQIEFKTIGRLRILPLLTPDMRNLGCYLVRSAARELEEDEQGISAATQTKIREWKEQKTAAEKSRCKRGNGV